MEADEHLEELPFDGELDFVPVDPSLPRNSKKKVVFLDILDMNLEVEWMSIDRL